ncbi:SAM-dependent methyltransferase [Streptomyces sp. RFCAC02]|uniref:SAM-dependent methyltransferase n=1 Tax=Streptomyces sp. RFCAC02 TaxID=2499143 RepID=UPI00101FDB21|nr:SAM-dependent methyltransferase [Streptomyces sp. RFCAC02]
MHELQVDTEAPDPARIYDYLLHGRNGKNHYPVDALAAERVMDVFPAARGAALANRAFMHRAVRTLTREAGITQFLDLGTGIPSSPNLHEVAQAADPTARVAYVDNRRIVLLYAQALLRSTPEGRTTYVFADVTEPDEVLGDPVVTELIDFRRPVALSLCALMHYITDEQRPHDILRRYLDVLAPGSHLILSHATSDYLTPEQHERQAAFARSAGTGQTGQTRDHGEVAAFFDGLTLLDPGLVLAHHWRPDAGGPAGTAAVPELSDPEVALYAGVARKDG